MLPHLPFIPASAFFILTALLQPQPYDILLLAVLTGALGIGIGGLLVYFLLKMGEHKRHENRSTLKARTEAERARLAERKRLNAIYNLLSALTASLNYQRVLDNALDLSATALSSLNADSDRLVGAVLLFTTSAEPSAVLSVGASRRFTAADTRILLPARAGLLAQVIDAGEPGYLAEVVADPELARIIALRSCRSVFCIPLQAGLETYGVLLFGHPEADYFQPESAEILQIVARQAVTAIQNARLYRDLEQEKERMLEIQEEARKKLARDLHDGPTQSVAAIAMRVNFARRLLDRDVQLAVDELVKIEDLARYTTKEIRHMLFTLRPLVLESQGLIPALVAMGEKVKETYNQSITISADASILPNLEMAKQAVIFYIVEEAVNNARKHAQATQVNVRLKAIETHMALLEIEDNGVGFNVGAVDAFYDKRGSLGLVNMRERAELVNGILRIDSVEGKGTLVQVAIPLTEEAADRLRSLT